MRSPSSRKTTSASRLNFRKLLESLVPAARPSDGARRGRLLLERLENRQLLAGDMELWSTDGSDAQPSDDTTAAETSSDVKLQSSSQAEGEAAPDLVQFAKDLADAGAKVYGAYWCPACTSQKQLFEDGGDNLPFINVSAPDRTPNQIGIDEEITEYPTWEFPDGTREVGVLDLQTISSRSGVAIPQSESPTFEEIGSQTVQIGSPLHIPIDAYDPDGGPLTVTVTAADDALVEATVISGNRSLRLDMEGYNDMVFELFEQRAPAPAGRVAQLAESGFYDGIIFHRVIDQFVIQAGDPTGTGTSGSSLGEFDDQFHPELQHNRSGILSFAKTNDDTNNSQFFVTETPTRHLDFNHSIFGQLVEGESVREAISSVETDDNGKPTTPITIAAGSVFQDTENSVIMLKALGGTGQTDVTVTVTDADGNTHSEVVSVEVVEDSTNSQPFLEEITAPPSSEPNTTAELQLSSIDIEGDDVQYLVNVPVADGEQPNASATVDSETGLVTVTPATDFSGEVDVLVGVQAASGGNDFDSQLVTFSFDGEQLAAPTDLDLQASTDTGTSDEDDITSASSLTFMVAGTVDGATVEILDTETGSVVGSTTASGTSATIATSSLAALGDGTYTLAARQRTGGQTSVQSPTLTLQYDNTKPASFASSAATQANVDRQYTTDLINAEEGDGLRYVFDSAPSGATIDPASGVISWTPSSNQSGTNTFTVELTDVAGNVRSESFTVQVNQKDPLAKIRLELTDLDGNPISAVEVGDEFLLNFYGVDGRSGLSRAGVFAAHADVLFNGSLVRAKPGSAIDYAEDFTTTQSGSFADGLIDELGAANSKTSPTEEAESLIATVTMEAFADGNVNFHSEPADATGSETLLYGIDEEITNSETAYGSTSLAIGLSFSLVDDAVTVDEDSGATAIAVLDNDQADASDNLAVVSVTQPSTGGSVTLSDGVVRFTPADDFAGTTEFTYRASDSGGGQQTATVTVTVAGVNDPPVGSADQFVVDENSSDNSLDVLANDTAGPGEDGALIVTAVSDSAEEATVSIAEDGAAVVYTPPAGFTGADSFTYTLSDGEVTTEVEVSVTVAPADLPPTASPDSFNVTEDDSEAEFDVLSNDTADEDGQTFALSDVGDPSQGGSARISEDGSQFFYTPAANFAGTEEVTYTLRDTGGGLAVGTVTFTVAAVNDPPPAGSPTITLNRGDGEQSVLTLDDLPENVDADESLEFVDFGETTAGGNVRIEGGEAIFYTPPSGDFTGEDTFTYTVKDPDGETSTGTVTIDVLDFQRRRIGLAFDAKLSAYGFSGDAIRISGTNALGEAVDMPLTFDGSQAVFEDLLPGEYTVNIPAIPFLQNAAEPQQIQVNSEPDDGDTEVTASVGRLRPEFVSVRDWLGSNSGSSVLTAVAPGEGALFTQSPSDTGAISNPVVEFSGDGSEVTIRGTDSNGDNVQATLPADGDHRVQTRGRAGELRLMRININGDDVTFEASQENASASGSAAESAPAANNTAGDNTAGSDAGGEGESLTAASTAPAVSSILASRTADADPALEPSSTSLTLGETQAEGESAATASVSRTDVFVPDPAHADARSQAAVLPLEAGELWMSRPLASEAADGEDDGRRVSSPADASGQPVDATMPLVAERLTVKSRAADAVALQRLEDRPLDASAVDAALNGELDD